MANVFHKSAVGFCTNKKFPGNDGNSLKRLSGELTIRGFGRQSFKEALFDSNKLMNNAHKEYDWWIMVSVSKKIKLRIMKQRVGIMFVPGIGWPWQLVKEIVFKCAVVGAGSRLYNKKQLSSSDRKAFGWNNFACLETLQKKENGLLSGPYMQDLLLSYDIQLKLTEMASISRASSSLSDDIERLFLDSATSDILLVVESKEIPAHRAILAARCPVFRAMFDSNMQEKDASKIPIHDIEFATVKSMLEYMYTGKTSIHPQNAFTLAKAADQYLLDALKVMCSSCLSGNLTTDNVVQSLFLADQLNMDDLKQRTFVYISKNSDVVSNEQWKLLKNNELFDALLMHVLWQKKEAHVYETATLV